MAKDMSKSKALGKGNLRWSDQEDEELISFVQGLLPYGLPNHIIFQKAEMQFQRTAKACDTRYSILVKRKPGAKQTEKKPIENTELFDNFNDALNFVRNTFVDFKNEKAIMELKLKEAEETKDLVELLNEEIERLTSEAKGWERIASEFETKYNELDNEHKTLLADQQAIANMLMRYATPKDTEPNSQVLQLVK